MAHLRTTVAIEASPDAVWAVLGEVAAASEWNPGAVSSSGGVFRVEPAADGGAVVVLDCDFEASDRERKAEFESLLRGGLEHALASLRRRVEQGLSWRAA